jgi:lysyl-tRNA synthetase class 1
MNEPIKIALDKVDVVRKIYEEIYGAPRPANWFPVQVICENCGKVGTTKVTAWDGEKVSYTCYPTAVKWTEGCGHSGKISPWSGKAKLLWKLDWAAKWKVVGVDIEGGGKDHYSKGGSRDVARRISEEVFDYPEPFGIQNEFFLIVGKKMSSSKGEGSSAKEVVELVPPQIFRLALFGKDMNQQINFDPAGDTIPVLFDTYDKLAEKYWSGIKDDDSRLFEYIHEPEARASLPDKKRFLLRFSQAAFLVQMPHLNVEAEAARIKGSALSELDKEELALRAKYAKRWLQNAASDEYIFELAETAVPEAAKSFSLEQKAALKDILSFIEGKAVLDGQELHTELHEIRKRHGLDAKTFFGAVYLTFLGKDHGPKAGWFLSVLEKVFLIARLKEVTKN